MPFVDIGPCTIADGASLAENNISAFWTNPNWIVLWPEKSLSHVISQAKYRIPRNLLIDTVHRRHQKAVNVETGKVVGYARWMLPKGFWTTEEEIKSVWSEARVPDVDAETERRIEEQHNAADWKPDKSSMELDEKVSERKDELMAGKNYLCEYLHHSISIT